MSIKVSDVSINTATIEVKVIKIGNRQVTQAVFRQLPEEQIIDFTTGTLRGTPWGRVNYHPDCDKDAYPHFHVVWQKGNLLYRTSIPNKWLVPVLPVEDLEWADDGNPIIKMSYALQKFLYARLLDGWLPERFDDRHHIYVEIDKRNFRFTKELADTLFNDAIEVFRTFKGREQSLAKWEEGLRKEASSGGDYYARFMEGERTAFQEALQAKHEMREKIIKGLEEDTLPIDSTELYHEYLMPAYRNRIAFEQTWKSSCEQLEQLDQLFIAV